MRYLMSISLICFSPLWVFGDVDSSVVQVSVRYQTGCQIAGQCSIVNDMGSGVVIGTLDGLPVVATCNHVVEKFVHRQALRCVIGIDSKWYGVTCIGYSERLDLALLQVQMAGLSDIDPVEIEEQPRLASDVQVIGYPQGRFAKVKAKYKSRSHIRRGGALADVMVSDKPTDQGESGGGLFFGDKLAGIVFGTTSTESFSTSGIELAKMARHFKVKLKAKARGNAPLLAATAPPPPSEPVTDNPQTGWLPDPGITAALKSINERLTAIEAKATAPGPAGPPGKDGVDGKSADTSALEKRLSAIESRGLTVQLIDESGAVVSEQKYAPGAPVKLQFNPLK
mgnify:CR=1 FL=1